MVFCARVLDVDIDDVGDDVNVDDDDGQTKKEGKEEERKDGRNVVWMRMRMWSEVKRCVVMQIRLRKGMGVGRGYHARIVGNGQDSSSSNSSQARRGEACAGAET